MKYFIWTFPILKKWNGTISQLKETTQKEEKTEPCSGMAMTPDWSFSEDGPTPGYKTPGLWKSIWLLDPLMPFMTSNQTKDHWPVKLKSIFLEMDSKIAISLWDSTVEKDPIWKFKDLIFPQTNWCVKLQLLIKSLNPLLLPWASTKETIPSPKVCSPIIWILKLINVLPSDLDFTLKTLLEIRQSLSFKPETSRDLTDKVVLILLKSKSLFQFPKQK